jgi:hypothetical protein
MSVYTRIKHLAKICIVSKFEPWISCIPQGCSDRYTTSVDVDRVYHMIYVRLHITVWLELSRPRPLRRPWCQPKPPCWHGFEAGFKFKPPGPVLPGCQWVPCQCSESKSVCVWGYIRVQVIRLGKIMRSLRPYTCSCKCSWAIKPGTSKPDAKRIKITCVGRLWLKPLVSPKNWRGTFEKNQMHATFHFPLLGR